MKRPEEKTKEGDFPTVAAFPYAGGKGSCIIKKVGGARPFVIYFLEQNGVPRFFESHRTQENAEAVARWMAMGL